MLRAVGLLGEDAWVADKEDGLFIDPEKVHYADYGGRYVRSRGPLTIPRTPQGRPVLMQAGASPRGRDFAARWAEAIFCTAGTKEDAIAFYTDVKGRMTRFGRSPDDCAVCTSITVVFGQTEAIAREKADYLLSLVPLEMVLATNSAMLGADLSKTADENELTRNKGHQGHGGLEDRIRQTMRAEGIELLRGRAPATQHAGRHASHDRRSHARSVRGRRLRRFRADADGVAADVGGIRRHVDARAAAPWPAAHRIRRRNNAREPTRLTKRRKGG